MSEDLQWALSFTLHATWSAAASIIAPPWFDIWFVVLAVISAAFAGITWFEYITGRE